jgi:hypothetical protein
MLLLSVRVGGNYKKKHTRTIKPSFRTTKLQYNHLKKQPSQNSNLDAQLLHARKAIHEVGNHIQSKIIERES